MNNETFSSSEMESFIAERVGPCVEVSGGVIEACREAGTFGGLIFDLVKETVGVMDAVSVYGSVAGGRVLMDRSRAICTGLVVRMAKLLMSAVKLSSAEEHGETVGILSRCVIESSIDLRYLLRKNSDELYERFVKVGLRGERNLYDLINSNIEKRSGVVLGIEARMLDSIERTCDGSGVDMEEVSARAGAWGGNLRAKMRFLGLDDDGYFIQTMMSQSVHGGWSDLVLNHLVAEENGYRVNTRHKGTDGQLLGPMALLALAGAREYVVEMCDPGESLPLRERIDDLLSRLARVEGADPGWEPRG